MLVYKGILHLKFKRIVGEKVHFSFDVSNILVMIYGLVICINIMKIIPMYMTFGSVSDDDCTITQRFVAISRLDKDIENKEIITSQFDSTTFQNRKITSVINFGERRQLDKI